MQPDKDNWLVSYPSDGNEVCFQMEDTSFWYRHRNRCILRAILSCEFDREFYDIGGGNGITAKLLQDNGFDVTLVEPYETGIRNAQARGVSKTVHTTLEEFKPPGGPLKGVGFFDVLEHIENDHLFLQHIHSLLTDDGKLILTVPAFQSLWSDNDVQLGHFRRYRTGQLETLLRSCGFEVYYKTYFFSVLWVPMWLVRVIPNVMGFSQKNTRRKKQTEHLSTRPFMAKILQLLLSWETSFIRKRKKIPFGTSCMIVAQKNQESDRP